MSWKATAYVKELRVAPNGEKITQAEKLLLFVLADYHHTQRDILWPSQRTLAEDALCSERNVRRLTDSLVLKGVLTVETAHGRGKLATYAFTELAAIKPDNTSGLGISDEDVKPDMEGNKTGQETGQIPPRNKEVERVNGFNSKPSASAVIPSKEETTDPRHSIVREKFKSLWLAHAAMTAPPGSPAPKTAPWNGRDAGILSKLLADNPSWTSRFLTFCLESYFQSENITGGDPFHLIAPKLTRYSGGRLDRFNKPAPRARDSQDAPDGLAEARRQRAAGRPSSAAGEGS